MVNYPAGFVLVPSPGTECLGWAVVPPTSNEVVCSTSLGSCKTEGFQLPEAVDSAAQVIALVRPERGS
jgi:hypothetical protein